MGLNGFARRSTRRGVPGTRLKACWYLPGGGPFLSSQQIFILPDQITTAALHLLARKFNLTPR
jgi:hypothetical protein